MGAADKPLKTAGGGKIPSQYWNPQADDGNGDYAYWEGDDNGAFVQIKGPSGSSPAVENWQDDLLNNQIGLLSNNRNMAYNDTTAKWERLRNNVEGVLLASAARTASASSPVQTNYNGAGLVVFVYVTAVGGSGGIRPYIRGIDPASGTQFDMLVGDAITQPGQYGYVMYPGAAGTAPNVKASVQFCLPRKWDVYIAASDSSSYTYSVGYSVID